MTKIGVTAEAAEAAASLALTHINNPKNPWRGRSLLDMVSVSSEELAIGLETAAALKIVHAARSNAVKFHYPSALALVFEKPSLRTRTSFEAGMAQLGGASIYLAPGDVGMGKRESVEDVAGALSRWVDLIAARVFAHSTVVELDYHATVPVINALSDREHPLQMFADLLTMQEQLGTLKGKKLAYVGDGNNVLQSLLIACARAGVHISAACPDGYLPDPYFITEATRIAADEATRAQVSIVTDPVEAVENANAVYTDVWTSMGQEEESAIRRVVFAPYCITPELMAKAAPGAFAMHCLPAHLGEEISAEAMQQHRTVILDQAENRLHTQKAIAALILGLE
jgi:ornithine carbamoyltransferase